MERAPAELQSTISAADYAAFTRDLRLAYGRVRRRWFCGLPFLMLGDGQVPLPPGANPRALVGQSYTAAFRDSEARAQALCATQPPCPNAAFIVLVLRPRFFVVRRGRFLRCLLVAAWVCVPVLAGPNQPPPLSESELTIEVVSRP